MVDFREMSSEDIEDLIDAGSREIRRRRILEGAQRRAEELTREVLEAEGVERGEAWRQPTGAHDAYPEGWTVEHDGQTWTSLVSGNVWEPGVSGWRAEAGEGEGPAEWVQPTGTHDAYQTGDRVLFGGQEWVSTSDGNVWQPGVFGWTQA